MKKKWTMAILIFTLLFGGAWQIHSKQKRVYGPGDESVSLLEGADRANAETIKDEKKNHKTRKPFKPREYIRIESITNE
ncbi:hypothetical protein [Falsibacillus pallidus]|uniref:Uncharacterized protein n=1 Tax=Falsibacillus pallidus TaxID=493781 RepID=A0A370G1U7_9BACI|nr:hypothetical protein [Falsibacillus pallidus]RDI36936.1 hypothetical protein DFR59_12423 [Falsibacillus pallidus]